MEPIKVVYYGYVFDASGYGQAARAYIHALHAAGVDLAVVNMANHAPHVHDPLIESLLGRKVDADFHLFHGIPTQWARMAFRVPNAIGMTVWETDTMPSQWRNALNHVIDVWLPCDFNVSVFERSLNKTPFKLPHPLPRHAGNGHENGHAGPVPDEIRPDDFVFYSIFEWQDRKCPEGMIEAYLRAFPEGGNMMLMLKTNPGAASAAQRALRQIRERVRSAARIVVRSEGWSDAQIESLHARGDCYVSLHRGEGWSYPLFEAVSRGTPVVATAYSGPMEYLDPALHHLVQYKLGPVRQPYIYYQPRMRWAEPDLNHAVEMMRSVYAEREAVRSRAGSAADAVKQTYSMEAVGAMARERMLELIKRTQPTRWKQMQAVTRASEIDPNAPIPGDWYDEEYFELGLKSHGWDRGYTWEVFEGLFMETGRFLVEMFGDAESYLDIGCAKGFLGRALHALGREWWGVDHSRWAIEHAHESLRPFMVESSVDTVRFDRQFDIVVAFEVFEHLTEEQARVFLTSARSWTRVAIFATIPSFETEEEVQSYRREESDLSHITMRTHEWWDALFRSAGWRQDPLHKSLEALCQRHPLPTKMGWKVYLYAP